MQRAPVHVRSAKRIDGAAMAATLARAFVDDPALGHIFPDRDSRPQRLRRFFALMLRTEDPAFIDIAVGPSEGTAENKTSSEVAAVAVWRPPGAWRTPLSTMLRECMPMLATFGTALPRTLRLQAQLEANHPPGPHWYLEFLGCDPARQGRGFGGAAVRARLARCDETGARAALETANPANVPLYETLGFRVTHAFDVVRGPHFWCMWREPR